MVVRMAVSVQACWPRSRSRHQMEAGRNFREVLPEKTVRFARSHHRSGGSEFKFRKAEYPLASYHRRWLPAGGLKGQQRARGTHSARWTSSRRSGAHVGRQS